MKWRLMDCVFHVKGESKTFRPRIKELKSFFPLLISLKPRWRFFSQKITSFINDFLTILSLFTTFQFILSFWADFVGSSLLWLFRWECRWLGEFQRACTDSHSKQRDFSTKSNFAPFFSKINREIEKISTKAKGQQTSTPLSEYEGMP